MIPQPYGTHLEVAARMIPNTNNFKGNLYIHVMLWLKPSPTLPLPVDLSCKLFASRICLLCSDKLYTLRSCRISRVRLRPSHSRRVWLTSSHEYIWKNSAVHT